jgi:hypothetical protein
MPNGQDFLDDIELERYIKTAPDRELLEFTARKAYESCVKDVEHDKRITALENRSNKVTGAVGSAGAFFGAAIVAIINFFVNRG